MKVEINKDACVGCGTCYSICENVFDIGDDGLAFVKEDADIEAFEEDVKAAIDACPTGAISDLDEE